MPEGDTIYKLAGFLTGALQGRRVHRGTVRSTPLTRLEDVDVISVAARGKHLFIGFDDGRLLRSHLGMWGSWHHYTPGRPWQHPANRASIVLDVGDRIYVCFNAREVEMLRSDGVSQRSFDARLGPDLLAAPVDHATIVSRARALSAPDRPITDVLLDQRIACGIGNVYKSETLFVGGWHPTSPLGGLADSELIELYQIAEDLLAGNRISGPRITRRATDEAGRLWVYGRAAQPCLQCDMPIASGRMGAHQRSTFWCPHCQPDRRTIKNA